MSSKQENKQKPPRQRGLHKTNHKFSIPKEYSTANQNEKRENISKKKRQISCSRKSTKSPLTKAPTEKTLIIFSQFFCENEQKPKRNDPGQGLFENRRWSQVTQRPETKHLHIFTRYNWSGSRKKKNWSWRRKGHNLKIANLPKQQSTRTEITWQFDGTEN